VDNVSKENVFVIQEQVVKIVPHFVQVELIMIWVFDALHMENAWVMELASVILALVVQIADTKLVQMIVLHMVDVLMELVFVILSTHHQIALRFSTLSKETVVTVP